MATKKDRQNQLPERNRIVTNPDGSVMWTPQEGDIYLVIGTQANGVPFRQEWKTWFMARGINLWRGRKYLVRDNKRILLEEVC